MTVEYLCVWKWNEGDDIKVTRCTIDIATGRPINFPEEAILVCIIEYDKGYEPILYAPDTTVELQMENTF